MATKDATRDETSERTATAQSMTGRQIDTVIVGGGQAGLAMSYYLKQKGRENVVLDRAPTVANAWRNERWDSFTLVTPNFQVRMPGAEYHGNVPYGFMSLAKVVKYFDDYVQRFDLPVHCGVEVYSVEKTCWGYLVRTREGNYHAENVVIATGLYQAPKIPKFSEAIPAEILQIHSMKYRNPSSLPGGAILVVGTGQSGAQIAQELYQSGRKVYLSIGSAGRVPRRYRGRDINDWFTRLGLFDTEVKELKSPRDKFASHPQISGKNGGQSLNLHQFARDGVVLLGRVREVRDGKLMIAADLIETLSKVDRFEADALKRIDDYIARTGLKAPVESVPQLHDGYEQVQIPELDLKASGISTVIWATGYSFDFGLVKLPVLDRDGYPIQKRGVTAYEGLYFLGMPWLHKRKSGILFGVGEDAAYLAERIAAREAVLYSSTSASRTSSAKQEVTLRQPMTPASLKLK
jgi:putative flavoprotein involved in K+ transport